MTRRTWTAVHSAVNRSLKLAELNGHAARLFFHQLLQAVDSHGCIDARPHILLVEVWPLLGETVASTDAAARELERVGLVVRKSDGKAEWLEIPDWNEKAGALIRKRGKRTFGAEPVRDQSRTSAAPVQQKGQEGQHKIPEVRDQSRTASNSTVSSLSSLTASPAGSERVSRTHAHEAPPAGSEDLSRTAREQIAMHPSLDRPAMHAAAIRWEAHLRASCPKGVWPSSTWAKNLTTWERWGMDAAIVAIDTAIGSNSWTPYQPQHRDAPPPTAAAPKPDPAAARAAQDRAARERDIERRWEEVHTVQREMPAFGGGTVVREVLDAKYPGHEAAERELRERGLLNGTPVLEKSR